MKENKINICKHHPTRIKEHLFMSDIFVCLLNNMYMVNQTMKMSTQKNFKPQIYLIIFL